MGLWFDVTNDELGYPEEDKDYVPYYSQIDLGGGHYLIEETGDYWFTYKVDYSEGNQIFIDTFLQEARAIVPIDTGYLMSTLNGDFTSNSLHAEASAYYAEYVEYGTCFMEAQPYFLPALEAALEAARPYWEKANGEANAKAREEIVLNGDNLDPGMDAGIAEGLIEKLFSILVLFFLAIVMTIFEEMLKSIGKSKSSRQSKKTREALESFIEIA